MRIRTCAEGLDPDFRIADQDLNPVPLIMVLVPVFPLQIKKSSCFKSPESGLISKNQTRNNDEYT